MEVVRIYKTANVFETNHVISVLEAEGIPCFSRDSGAGGYLNVSMGFSEFGEWIFVDESDRERALLLIEGALKDSELEVRSEDEIDINSYPWYKRRNGLLRAYLLATFLILAIIYVCIFIFAS